MQVSSQTLGGVRTFDAAQLHAFGVENGGGHFGEPVVIGDGRVGIGINLYHAFLEKDGNATLDSIRAHVEHFLSRGAEEALCLGCDMDGADLLDAIPDLSYLDRLANHLSTHGYSQSLIDALFFENAYRFAQKHF